MVNARASNRLASLVRDVILSSGLSQHQIARETGLRQPSLSKFLKGGSIKIESLGVLLDYLDLEVRPQDTETRAMQVRETGDMGQLKGLNRKFSTILADPPWRFQNRTGKMAPEHKRLRRYRTMSLREIKALPVAAHADNPCHLYLWCPNALLREGLEVMEAWGFTYKTNIVWYKTRKDGGPDGRGVGFYFRNVTELLLFGLRGSMRTLDPGRRQVNIIRARKREHSRKPVETYDIIEQCSPGPYLELFARERIDGWTSWGNEVDSYEQSRPLHKAYNGQRISTNAIRSQGTLLAIDR
jgi:N6-adenosine-specific RNA methylase IME4/predicted XRE-type DNA-binding protein